MEQFEDLREFKQKALDKGCTKIQLDGGLRPVDLAEWQGVATIDAAPGFVYMASVRYYLHDKRLRVRRDHLDIWYTLS